MAEADAKRPSNAARRTRRALLEAASRLMRAGRSPTLEEVAEEALVSRATAYRYFTGVEPLIVEAALHVAMPLASMFEGDPSTDPLRRLLRADEAVHEMVLANEAALRMMLIHSLQSRLDGGGGAALPARQNRRTPLIEAALAPARGRIAPDRLDRLVKALALVIGTEAMLVFKDVLQLADAEARETKAWMIEALLEAAAGAE
jgi:AcrR family transcriptional regulator